MRPRDTVGKARKQLALDYAGELERLDARLRELKRQISDVLAEHPTSLAGKTHNEALRCLKRRISDAVHRCLVADLAAAVSQGGQVGASLQSSAADLIPMIDTSEQSLPGLDADPTPIPAAMP